MQGCNLFLRTLLVLVSFCLVGCNNSQASICEQGVPGEAGKDGTSILTGYGVPSIELGNKGDTYIDLDSWDYYLKEDAWVKKGNIKGKTGDTGEQGVSIINTYINDDGELIVEFSDGTSSNAGKVVDKTTYSVQFYLSDALVDTQIVKKGEKVKEPVIEEDDIIINGWYLNQDFTQEWVIYGYVVTENMDLYADYSYKTKTYTYSNSSEKIIDENGNLEFKEESNSIFGSKVEESTSELVDINERGIIFNKEEKGYISSIKIDIDDSEFEQAKLFYGNNPLPIDNYLSLSSGVNNISLIEHKAEYFVIQNQSEKFEIKSITIEYRNKYENNNETDLPKIYINTENEQEITSRTEYINCALSTKSNGKDVSNISGKVKIRGNSTANLTKKPYRIKLDKKSALFGYTKAKNWALLADFMDGSKMHNYIALSFAEMVRGDGSFAVKPLHVKLFINGIDKGLYLFCEHCDEKEGRLNIEQEKIWTLNFDEINFSIERDRSVSYYDYEIEGENYFKVYDIDYLHDNYQYYVFALNYPEKDDFNEELDDGTTLFHESEWTAYFNNLKEYVTDICHKFDDYNKSNSNFDNINNVVDVESLALYGATDQLTNEFDHNLNSFKMYRVHGEKLKFGPNWDYDSCAYGLPWPGTYIKNPFNYGYGGHPDSDIHFEEWSHRLYCDTVNGKPLYKNIWDNLSVTQLNDFTNGMSKEISSISYSILNDCDMWMNGEYYVVFDNLNYVDSYYKSQINYLKNAIYQ